jgi:hypothetical protein
MMIPEATIGRERETLVLGRFVDQAESDGGVLVLSGEAGIGKSHMLRAACAAAWKRGLAVHRVRGVEFESTLRLAGLYQVLQPFCHEFSHLGRSRRKLLEAAMGFRHGDSRDIDLIADAVGALFVRATRAHPTLLVVDDSHWLDAPSKSVIATVAGTLTGSRVGLLMSACPAWDDVGALACLPTCELHPLDDTAAADLVRARFPDLPGPLLGRVVEEAQGNPLMLCELPSALTSSDRAFDAPPPGVLPLSERLHRRFGSQITRLPAVTRRVLLLAALDHDWRGTVLTGERLLLQGSELALLSPAVHTGLIDLDPSSRHLSFRHPLVRTTLLASSTSAERRDAHRALSIRALRSENRMRHLAHVTLDRDEGLAHQLEEVARHSPQGTSASRAVALLQQSADLTPERTDRAHRLAQAAYLGVDLPGNLPHVDRLLAEAREADPGIVDRLPAATADACARLHVDGNVDAAYGRLVAAIDRISPCVQPLDPHLIDALYLLTEICAHGGRPALLGPVDDVLDRIGAKAPRLLVVLRDLAKLPRPSTPAHMDELIAAIQAMTNHDDPITVTRTAMAAPADWGSGVRDTLWRIAGTSRTAGPCPSALRAAAALAGEAFLTGRWDDATLIAKEGRTSSDLHGYQLASHGFQLDQALVLAARGRHDRVVDDITAGVGRWAAPRGARLLQLKCHRIHVLAALGRGDFEDAYQHARVVCLGARPRDTSPLALELTLDLVEAAMRTNRHSAAAEHLTSMEAAEIASLSPRLAMIAAASAGVLATHDAVHHFETALAVGGAERWPFDLARVHLAYGERLRRTRAPAESRTHLVAAQEAFERLGAVTWAARATKELDATARTKGGGDVCGPGSLTPQEREVALLAASGLTNKDIAGQLLISHRTVGAHLRSIFPKLGINTRACLRDALQAQSLAGV